MTCLVELSAWPKRGRMETGDNFGPNLAGRLGFLNIFGFFFTATRHSKLALWL